MMVQIYITYLDKCTGSCTIFKVGLKIRQVSGSLAFHINPHDLVREHDSFSPIKPAMPNDITGFSQMVF